MYCYRIYLVMLVLVLGGCQTMNMPVLPQADLITTVDRDVLPYVARELSRPRFQGRPIMLVKFERGQISSNMDPLTAALRQRLEHSLLQHPGIVLYRSGADLVTLQEQAQNSLCLERPQLYLGLELKQTGQQWLLSLRMLDRQQGNRWVDGFAYHATVRLTARQQEQWAQSSPDPWLNGFRESPYALNDFDLAVRDLGHQLKCQLMQHSALRQIYIDTSAVSANVDLKPLLKVLQSDLPSLTGVPVTLAHLPEPGTQQTVLQLQWLVLEHASGKGRLSLSNRSPKGTDNRGFKPLYASTYITGVKAQENSVALKTHAENHLAASKPLPSQVIVPVLHTTQVLTRSAQVSDKLPAVILPATPLYGTREISGEGWSVRF